MQIIHWTPTLTIKVKSVMAGEYTAPPEWKVTAENTERSNRSNRSNRYMQALFHTLTHPKWYNHTTNLHMVPLSEISEG